MDSSSIDECRGILSYYISMVQMWKQGSKKIGQSFPFPIFSIEIIKKLCDFCIKSINQDNMLVEIENGVIVVGDLNGNIINLLQILALHGIPPQQRYLFLGNYIGTSGFSFECVIFLFALKMFFPQDIILLRGSQEMYITNELRSCTDHLYSNGSLEDTILGVFSYMPLGSIISDSIFCSSAFSLLLNGKKELLKNINRPLEFIRVEEERYSEYHDYFIDEEEIEIFSQNNNVDYVIIGGTSPFEGIETYLNGKYFSINSSDQFGLICIINIPGDGIPCPIIIKSTGMHERKNSVFRNIIPKPIGNQHLIRPQVVSTNGSRIFSSSPKPFSLLRPLKLPSLHNAETGVKPKPEVCHNRT